MKKPLSADVLAYFREQSVRGGKIGGKRNVELLDGMPYIGGQRVDVVGGSAWESNPALPLNAGSNRF